MIRTKHIKAARMIGSYMYKGSALAKKEINKNALAAQKLHLAKEYAKRFSHQLGIQVDIRGSVPNLLEHNYFVVCNHLSYVDVIATQSILPCVFVTSMEMKNSPFIGKMARLANAIFIERRNRDNIHNEIKNVASYLNNGFNVCLYPEGTSTNGEQILPFKRSFFDAAIISDTPVLPIAIRYTHIDNRMVDENNRDTVCWYGKMSFFPHFKKLLSAQSIRCELIFGEPIHNTGDYTRRELADKSRELVAEMYFDGLRLQKEKLENKAWPEGEGDQEDIFLRPLPI